MMKRRPQLSDYLDENNHWRYELRGTPAKTKGKEQHALTDIDKFGPCYWCNSKTPKGDNSKQPRWHHDPIESALGYELIVCWACYRAAWNIRKENSKVHEHLVARGWKPQERPTLKKNATSEEDDDREVTSIFTQGNEYDFVSSGNPFSTETQEAQGEEAARDEGRKQRSTQQEEQEEAYTSRSSIQLANLNLEWYPHRLSTEEPGEHLKRLPDMQTEDEEGRRASVNKKADVRSSEEQGKRKRAEAQEKTPKKEVKKARVDAIQDKLSQMINSILSEELCDIEGELNEVKDKNNSLSKQVKNKNKELKQVKEQNKNLTEELHRMKEDNKKLTEELDRMKEENKNLTEQRDKAMQEGTERTMAAIKTFMLNYQCRYKTCD